jgi:hypothetical protein
VHAKNDGGGMDAWPATVSHHCHCRQCKYLTPSSASEYPHELILRAGELTTHAVATVVDLRDNEFHKPTARYKRKMDAQCGHFRPRNYRPERQFMRGQTEMGTRRSVAKNGTESNRIAEERA